MVARTHGKVSAKFRREAKKVSQDKIKGPVVKALIKKFERPKRRIAKGDRLLPGRNRTDNQISAAIALVNAESKLRQAFENAAYFSDMERERLKKMTDAQFKAWHHGTFKASKTPAVIHVNQLVIRSNAKRGENNPPLTVRKGRNGKNAQAAHEVIVNGPSRVIHSPHKPLKCGARVWIETNAEVELIGG